MRRRDISTANLNDPKEPRFEEKQVDKRDRGLEMVRIPENDEIKVIKIGSHLGLRIKEALMDLLREYNGVFAWTHKKMPGIYPSISTHRLYVGPSVWQKKIKKKGLQSGKE